VGLLAAAWAGAFVATHVPASGLTGLHGSDTQMHLLGYMGLAGLFWLLRRLQSHSVARRGPVVLAVLMVYGVLDELTQPLVGRSAGMLDWLADATGIALAVILCELAAAAVRLTSPK